MQDCTISVDCRRVEIRSHNSIELHRKRKSVFIRNQINSSKYSILSFFPKQLYNQFTKVANLYFLLVSGLQLLPGISPTGKYTTILPLSFFVSLTMLREAFDDHRRHLQDLEENNKQAEIFNNEGSLESVSWQDLCVGDLVKVRNTELVPADLLIISSEESNNICYTETSCLDGETSLKRRYAISTAPIGVIECEKPNHNMYSLNGTFFGQKRISFSIQNCILRGSRLMNTESITGVVLYTGEDTKVRRNVNEKIRTKNSWLEIEMTNKFIIFVLLFVFGLSIVSTVIHLSRKRRYFFWYLPRTTGVGDLKLFLSFFILYNTMIPLALYVMLETIKLIQAFLMRNDIEMYHEKSDTPANTKTSSLNEELGQLKYLFTDKTGTLTQNEMIFKYFGFGNCIVNHKAELFRDIGMAIHQYTSEEAMKMLASYYNGSQSVATLSCSHLESYLIAICVCHTAVMSPDFEYQSSSPDEVALLNGLKEMGCILVSNFRHILSFDIVGRKFEYQILDELEFSSSRKRMSVIVKIDNAIFLYSKGADQVIGERCEIQSLARDQIDLLAAKGYRTLVYAMKQLESDEYSKWKEEYEYAKSQLHDRKKFVEECCDKIEQNMKYLGVAAVEDRLQENVPETIHKLRDAGINIWILTGDKKETVINVGRSSNIILPEDEILQLDKDNLKENLVLLHEDSSQTTRSRQVLVISGYELHLCEGDPEMHRLLFEICSTFLTVICCRITPRQKSSIVRSVKNLPSKEIALTAAIGDGANDVAMIQEAHVGIGISGKEGLRASRAADYSIGQFRFLQRLILVHGHLSYVRTSKYMLGMFYKSMSFYLVQSIYQTYSSFSSTSLYEAWTLALNNIIWTAFAVFFIGIFEQDFNPEQLLTNPTLYKIGPQNGYYNIKTFVRWFIQGLFHSAVGFFLPILLHASLDEDCLHVIGTTIFTCMILIINIKLTFIECKRWNAISVLGFFISVLFWILWQFIYSFFYISVGVGFDVYGLFPMLFGKISFYLIVCITIITALLPDLIFVLL